ncbi:MAG: chromosome segregation protein SMC, partial [Neisseria sp.]|nr:chromosome segregation protein SMC [Neisseria sp.]
EAAALLQQQQAFYEDELGAGERRSADLKARFQTASAAYQDLYQKVIAARAEQQALASLLADRADDDSFWENGSESAAPVLWQHIRAPEEWRHALSVVLAGRLQARAVNADFMPPETLPEAPAAWFDKTASASRKTLPAQAFVHQISADAPFQTALQHWLDGALCAPDLTYALARRADLQGNQYWITPEGHRIDRIGALLYHAASGASLIEQKARHDRLAEELAELEPQLAAAERERDAVQAELETQEAEDKQRLAQQRQHAGRLQAAQARATELLAKTNQGQLRREHIETELAQLAEEAEVSAQISDGLAQDCSVLQEAAAELERGAQETGSRRQAQQNALKQAQLALLEANRRYGVAEVAAHKLQQRQQNLQQQLDNLARQTLDWQERQSELALAYETEQQDDEQRIRLESLGEEIFRLDEQLAAAEGRLKTTQEQGRELYAKQQTLAASLPQIQAAVQTALLQQQEALLNAKRFHDNLTGREADFAALEKLASEAEDLKALSDGIGGLAQKIQALGAVNLAALQELEEARERDGYYRGQSEDVQSAIALLEEAIAQIDGETKARFKETFDAVNAKVQTFFPTLFGGGEAVLQMIGDDLLTAGVSIMARPPGKKNSTIHLLSGGEKA